MFLSQLILNGRCHDVQRDLADPYQLHRTLSRAWGDGDEYDRARVLFRVEEAREGSPLVLVQSKVAPEWAFLEQSDYLNAAPQVKEWSPRLEAGQSFAFRLRANPTVKREGKRRGIYHPIGQGEWLARKAAQHGFELPMTTVPDADHQPVRAPLVRANSEGQRMSEPRDEGRDARFTRVRAKVGQHDKTLDKPKGEEVIGSGVRRMDKGEAELHAALICAERFEGVLRVVDVQVFLAALENGIGSAKGLGFGLLSLARPEYASKVL